MSRQGPTRGDDRPGERGRRPGPAVFGALASVKVGVAGLLGVAGIAVVAAVLVGAMAGTGVAAGEAVALVDAQDGDPPEIAGGERINDTAVAVRFTDDSGVDVSSISQSEFLVSAGEIEAVSAHERGTDAEVTVLLAAPIDEDELTIAVRDGSAIQDIEGNQIDTSTFVGVTVDGMDAVAPALQRMSVPEYASDRIEYRLVFDEPVDSFAVRIGGARELRLDEGDFERVRASQYRLTYEPPVDGVYTFELQSATDRAGNTDTFAVSRSTEVQSAAVRAVASVDLSASSGLNFTFDATNSEQRARAYIWSFGDGSTANGQRVSHTFAPGNYTVELEVIDEFGNVGQDRLTLNLTGDRRDVSPGNAGTRPISVDRTGSPRPTDAQVSVTESDPGERLVIRAESIGEPLLATEPFSLEELVVTPADGGPFGLGMTVLAPTADRLDGVADASGGTPIAGFHVRPTVSEADLSEVTLRYSVSRDRLEEVGVDPENVTLYRSANGSWTAEPTAIRSISRNRASFESAVPGFSRFAVVADTDDGENSTDGTGGESGEDEGSGEDPGTDEGNGNGSGMENGGDGENGAESSVSDEQFSVTNVSLNETSVEPGDAVELQAEVVNDGDEPGDYLAALAVEGTVVETKEVLRIPPNGESLPIAFTYTANETGTVQLSINGTAAPPLEVGDDGGGGLFSFLSFLPLGFLPWGLLRTLVMYVLLPLAVIGGLLKGVASYMGY